MNNNLLQVKIKERLNKLASFDYDNIECWQIAEAFNKAQISWTRTQLRGYNLKKEGDGSSKQLIDDLQFLLKPFAIRISKKDRFYETATLPGDYLSFKSISIKGKTDCCPERSMKTDMVDSSDVDKLLDDYLSKPNFEWGETFATLIGKKVRIYTDNKFELTSPSLLYYRKARDIKFDGCIDISTGLPSNNVTCEFSDDVAEILVDEAAAILAGDMELFNQRSLLKERVTTTT
jgi:hypothetical protein